MNKVPIHCTFRSRGFSEEDIAQFETDLAEIAVLQPRRQQMPEAGGLWDMCFSLPWPEIFISLGTNAFWDFLKQFSQCILALWDRKSSDNPNACLELWELRFRFNDIDVVVQPLAKDDGEPLARQTVERLVEVLQEVQRHLRSHPLKSEAINSIECYEPHPELTSSDANGFLFTRPWSVQPSLVHSIFDYYPHEMKLIERE